MTPVSLTPPLSLPLSAQAKVVRVRKLRVRRRRKTKQKYHMDRVKVRLTLPSASRPMCLGGGVLKNGCYSDWHGV